MVALEPGGSKGLDVRRPDAPWLADGWFAIGTWAIWRLAHLALVAGSGGDPVRATFFLDGAWMRSIVDHGYRVGDGTYATQTNAAFLPSTPALGRLLGTVVQADVAGVIVANLTGLAAFCAVFTAVREVVGPTHARRSVVALALWPGSLVLWAFMSEGAFIALTALAVSADNRGRHVQSALAAWAAGTFRVVGFTVGPALALARVLRTRRIDRVVWAHLLAGVASIVTVAAVQQWAVGDMMAFSRAQRAWDRDVGVPGGAAWRAADLVVTDLPHLHLELGMNLASLGLTFGALVVATARYGLRGREGRVLIVAWTAFLVPAASSTISSQVRYVMGAWGALLVLGAVPRRSRWVSVVLAVAGAAVSAVLVVRWSDGSFVA